MEEGRVICHLANLCALRAECVIDGIDLARANGRWDWMHTFPNMTLLLDYDGSYFHGPDRVSRDRTKSLEAVNSNPNVMAVRVRMGAAAPLGTINHHRIHVLDVRDGVGPEEIALRILTTLSIQVPSMIRSQDGDGLLNDVMCVSNMGYRKNFQRLVEMQDRQWAQQMLMIHGARQRMSLYVDTVVRLRTEWQMDTKQLTTLMCDGVASRIDSDGFWTGLETLRTDPHVRWCRLADRQCRVLDRARDAPDRVADGY